MMNRKHFKAFLLLGVMFLGLVCTGCGDKQDKICVDLRIDGISHCVTIDKGRKITKDIIPVKDNEGVALFYYDARYQDEYNNTTINEDVTIYVKYYSFEELIEKAKSDFMEQYNGVLGTKHCYGEFDGALVFFVPGDAFDVSNPKPVNQVVSRLVIYGFIFDCPYDFSILMWKNGQFYKLPNYEVEINGWLTEAHAEKIHEKHLEFFE